MLTSVRRIVRVESKSFNGQDALPDIQPALKYRVLSTEY